jgi:hypothetical protein
LERHLNTHSEITRSQALKHIANFNNVKDVMNVTFKPIKKVSFGPLPERKVSIKPLPDNVKSNINICKLCKYKNGDIIRYSDKELDILNFKQVKEYLDKNNFDILVHTAIKGGRRTKVETGEITHINILMFENLIIFADKFKMIINLDSAAIYDRTIDILNRKENELFTIPTDYYGFSKYVIYNRTLNYSN